MKSVLQKATTARHIFKKSGLPGIVRHIKWKIEQTLSNKRTEKRLQNDYLLTEDQRREILQSIEDLSKRPLISVVVPVYNVEEKWLRLCIGSVLRQLYPDWELCIADDCSTQPHVRSVLKEFAEQDPRIKVAYRSENGHISKASNSALELATGDFTVLLDNDDELTEDALFFVARELVLHPETDMFYSDEDKIDEESRLYFPSFKPDWSRDLFYSLNLVTHLSGFRTETLRKIGGFRVGYEGSQDYDLALRVVEQISDKNIRHIPRILYHWRALRGSVALSGKEKSYAHERARKAIRSHFERTGKKALVTETIYNLHRVQYEVPNERPKVSLILRIDPKDHSTEKVLRKYVENTDYPNLEIVVVGPSASSEVLDSFSAYDVKLIRCKGTALTECLNLGASESSGEILCFADAELIPLDPDWLTELARFALQPEIGAVGGKVLYADGSVMQSGLLIGVGAAVGTAHSGAPRDFSGNMGRNIVVGNYSAVSVSCMATRRKVFNTLGGFDAGHFGDRLFDADYCLRLGQAGLRIVLTPYAELIQADRKKLTNVEKPPVPAERVYFEQKWSELISRDPFYNPNLSRLTPFAIGN